MNFGPFIRFLCIIPLVVQRGGADDDAVGRQHDGGGRARNVAGGGAVARAQVPLRGVLPAQDGQGPRRERGRDRAARQKKPKRNKVEQREESKRRHQQQLLLCAMHMHTCYVLPSLVNSK